LINNYTFGAVVAYGAFYLSYATLETFVVPPWNSAGIPATDQNLAVAHYLFVWTVITAYFTIASLCTSVVVFSTFFSVETRLCIGTHRIGLQHGSSQTMSGRAIATMCMYILIVVLYASSAAIPAIIVTWLIVTYIMLNEKSTKVQRANGQLSINV